MDERHSEVTGRRSIMSDWSIEATLPRPEEVEILAQLVRPGTEVYLSTLPHVSLDQQIETARIVRASGLEPVPHIAVRYFFNRSELSGYLDRVVGEANVSRCLIIGGDLDIPRGEFDSTVQLIECGLLPDFGIQRIAVAGYPEGHPKIAPAILQRALMSKLELARCLGIEVQVITQFCFSSDAIISWVAEFRRRWADVPVRIGLAGPASVKALLKYAARCGVKAPLSGFARKFSMMSQLARSIAPDVIIRDIDAAAVRLQGGSNLSAHFYSFGGLERTTRWAIDENERRNRRPSVHVAARRKPLDSHG